MPCQRAASCGGSTLWIDGKDKPVREGVNGEVERKSRRYCSISPSLSLLQPSGNPPAMVPRSAESMTLREGAGKEGERKDEWR